jgi:hypothetical protein
MADTGKRKSSSKRSSTPTQKAGNRAGGSPSEDEIRRRAYQLYEERGGEPGDAFEDWARAERELRGKA